MNPSKAWNTKLEAASFFAVKNPVQAVCNVNSPLTQYSITNTKKMSGLTIVLQNSLKA